MKMFNCQILKIPQGRALLIQAGNALKQTVSAYLKVLLPILRFGFGECRSLSPIPCKKKKPD